ncbi:MAG: class I SAM-dependent methyltransferase [bacterium]|nr:class I SAM-dependent methyltransferase [bacterium]
MTDASRQRAEVQRSFSRDSAYYVTSTPHARSSSLARAAEVLNPKGGILLDLATGAGHTAFAMAPRCDRVIASDLTAKMLDQARRLGAEKKIGNAIFLRTDAENIAFADGTLDYVSVRIAPHHFADVQRSINEMARVLKPGGRAVYVDNIAPEEAAEAKRYNDFEERRDPSHNRCDSLPVLVEMFESASLRVLHTENIRKRMDFEEWVRRPHITGEIEEELRQFLLRPTPAIRHWLAPREEEGQLVFDEVEAVILAERP